VPYRLLFDEAVRLLNAQEASVDELKRGAMSPEHAPRTRLRALKPADVDVVVDICRQAFDSESVGAEVRSMLLLYCRRGIVGVPLTRQSEEALPREYFTIIVDDGSAERIVGITGIYRLGTWTWAGNLWLGWTAVEPSIQGLGIGGASLHAVMRIARSRGAERLKVETAYGSRSTGFYLRNGFVEEARLRAHYGPGVNAAILSRSLLDIEPMSGGGDGNDS
jgi:GNAT superfamily N-acetyltransferase